MTTRICIVSSSAERRQEIKAALARLPNSTIAGEISESGGLRLLAPLAPDLVLLDAEAPGINPLSVLHMHLLMPVVVLIATEGLNQQHAFEALGAHTAIPPSHFNRLASILVTIAGQTERAASTLPQQRQPSRRHWAQQVSTILTRH